MIFSNKHTLTGQMKENLIKRLMEINGYINSKDLNKSKEDRNVKLMLRFMWISQRMVKIAFFTKSHRQSAISITTNVQV